MLPVLATLLAAGCGKPGGEASYAGGDQKPRAVSLLASGGLDREQIRQAGRNERYDDNPGASDEGVLDDSVHAVIEPQEGVWSLDSATLDRGAVVARFRNLSQTPLRRLGLAPRGTTYWYIYRSNGRLLSAYIADQDSAGYDRQDVPTLIHRPGRAWRQSVAQWQLAGVLGESEKQGLNALGLGSAVGLESGTQPWVSCITWGCCKPTN